MPLNVAVLIYPGADPMDFTGPTEVYSTRPKPPSPPLFTITTFAHTSPVASESEALVYAPTTSFSTVQQNLDTYDILVVPGAHPDVIAAYLSSAPGAETVALVRRFAGLAPRGEARGVRVLQSVCSGALILGAAGVLAEREATTHHWCFDMLAEYADAAAGGTSGIRVVRKRWVDGGTTEGGVRVVSAGGVSSGIDASLWVVEMVAGEEAYRHVEDVLEFERRGEEEGFWG